MRVLFLTQILPYPLDAGPKLRAYYVLRHLAQKHSVTLVSFSRKEDTSESIQHLQQFYERVVTVPMQRSRAQDGMALARSLINNRSFIITRDERRAMNVALKELLGESTFDAIHSDQLWMAQYALAAKRYAVWSGSSRLILDQHNTVYMIPHRMQANTHNLILKAGLWREASLMRRYEAQTCREFDQIVCVTDEDRGLLEELMSNAPTRSGSQIPPVTTIPICIDPGGIRPVHPLSRSPEILFIGGMNWPPNLEGVSWFIQSVFPELLAKIPDARFHLIGKEPPAALRHASGVIAPGYVGDVEPYWRRSRVFVAPLLAGGGMRVKILDAWAHGLPVVSTSIGAEGLTYRNGENIFIADTPEEVAGSLIKLLTGAGLAEQVGANARRWVEDRYDWRKEYSRWDSVYP
jgi:glycosyltransferase involved in cell wall biosynthesis